MALKIEAVLTGDGTGFYRMMGKAQLMTRELAATITGPLKNAIAGAFTIGSIEALGSKVIRTASHFRDLADTLQVNVEWLQALSAAARTAGANEDELTRMLVQVNKARGLAVGGNATAMKGFQTLGFNADQVKNMPTQQFFERLAETFRIEGPQAFLPVMQELGIRASAQLSAAFSEGIISMADEAREAGEVMAEDVIDALDEAGDKLEILKTQLLVSVAPAIVWVIEKLKRFHEVLRAVGAWIGGFIGGGSLKSANEAFQAEQDMIAGETVGAENLQRRRRAMRRRRELSAPGFIMEPTPERARSPYSDSLLSVGNFLGSGGGRLESIAARTNTILMDNGRKLDRIGNALELSGAGMGINEGA